MRGRWLLGLLGAAVAAGAVPTGANAGGTNTWLCGQTHHGAYEWTVEAILSTSEDAHPDVTCAQARKTVAAIDGGKGTGVKRSSSPASGQAEIVYGKWTCTIAQGGAKATFMARKVQGRQSWVTCYDGVDVDGVDDAIAYSYGVEPQIPS